MTRRLNEIEEKIRIIKGELMLIEHMRPGNLNQQFRKPKEKIGGYYQLNYTHKNKTKTEYVRQGMIDTIQSELNEYKKFRELSDEWIELSIEASKLRIKES
jgi:hypothetical protein